MKVMETKKPLNFVLIGRSGSGKGTQAKLILDKYPKTEYISTGDLFRDLAKQDTEVGRKIKEVVENGGLPFDDLATTLWMYNMAYKVKEDEGIMIDGAPRRLDEARNLDKFLEWLGRIERTAFVLVDISRKEAFARLSKRRICSKCGKLIPFVGEYKDWQDCHECGGQLVGRPDDAPEAINSRLDYFDKSVVPVLDYYEKKGFLIKINGQQSIEDVFSSITAALSEKFDG